MRMRGVLAPRPWRPTPVMAHWSNSCSSTAPIRTRPRPALPRCMRRSCAGTRRWSARSSPMARTRTRPFAHRTRTTTALMAATGMGGGGTGWVQPQRSEREALTLEAVTLAAELGVDVNVANTDGRTALDAAKALKYETVVKFLLEKGARSKESQQQ